MALTYCIKNFSSIDDTFYKATKRNKMTNRHEIDALRMQRISAEYSLDKISKRLTP